MPHRHESQRDRHWRRSARPETIGRRGRRIHLIAAPDGDQPSIDPNESMPASAVVVQLAERNTRMKIRTRVWSVGLVLAAALAGTGSAYATTNHSSPQGQLVNQPSCWSTAPSPTRPVGAA